MPKLTPRIVETLEVLIENLALKTTRTRILTSNKDKVTTESDQPKISVPITRKKNHDILTAIQRKHCNKIV